MDSLNQQFEGLSTDIDSIENKVSTLYTEVAELSTTLDSFSKVKEECQDVVSGLAIIRNDLLSLNWRLRLAPIGIDTLHLWSKSKLIMNP